MVMGSMKVPTIHRKLGAHGGLGKFVGITALKLPIAPSLNTRYRIRRYRILKDLEHPTCILNRLNGLFLLFALITVFIGLS